MIPARQRLAFRLLDDRNVLGLLMIAPAAAFLLVFLAYPLGLGFWLGMTDATIGQPGRFVGFANFISLAHDQIFWLSVFNTTFYTVVASALKFGLGLYLALLLNRRTADEIAHPRRRAVAVCHADRAVGDRLLVDLRSAILDHLLVAHQARSHPPVH